MNKSKPMEVKTMKEVKIALSNIQDIRDFVNQVILADYDVDLVQVLIT